jgi:hypothetical protein
LQVLVLKGMGEKRILEKNRKFWREKWGFLRKKSGGIGENFPAFTWKKSLWSRFKSTSQQFFCPIKYGFEAVDSRY